MHDHANVEQQKRLQRWRFYPVDAEGVVNVAYHDEPMMLDKNVFFDDSNKFALMSKYYLYYMTLFNL